MHPMLLLFDHRQDPPAVLPPSDARRTRDAVCVGHGGLQHDVRRRPRARRLVRVPHRTVSYQGALTGNAAGAGLQQHLHRWIMITDHDMFTSMPWLAGSHAAHRQARSGFSIARRSRSSTPFTARRFGFRAAMCHAWAWAASPTCSPTTSRTCNGYP